jgi:hypothetical protein
VKPAKQQFKDKKKKTKNSNAYGQPMTAKNDEIVKKRGIGCGCAMQERRHGLLLCGNGKRKKSNFGLC